jgi:hypothetical protein
MINYSNHITKYEDLITSYNETRAGFISIALEKNRRATPYIEEARVLQNRIKTLLKPEQLITLPEIKNGLIAASGISDKAAVHLGEEGCKTAIQEFVKNFLVPAGDKFKEELIFRFLLTKGDSLGGSMRNVVGALAQKKLCLSIVSSLRLTGINFHVLNDSAKKWISSKDITDDVEIENAKGLSWKTTKKRIRTLYFNVTVPIVKNNIDIILLNTPFEQTLKEAISIPENYLALGELKGGIDPAGADEHWKTAKTAIDRINNAFNKNNCKPSIFYIGAAIENKMASEIYANLKTKYISNAANLTNPDHIVSLVEWLISI